MADLICEGEHKILEHLKVCSHCRKNVDKYLLMWRL